MLKTDVNQSHPEAVNNSHSTFCVVRFSIFITQSRKSLLNLLANKGQLSFFLLRNRCFVVSVNNYLSFPPPVVVLRFRFLNHQVYKSYSSSFHCGLHDFTVHMHFRTLQQLNECARFSKAAFVFSKTVILLSGNTLRWLFFCVAKKRQEEKFNRNI